MIIPMLCVTIFVILVVWFLLPRVARLMIHTPTAISIFVCLRSEERFSRNAETDLVCRLLLEKKKQHVVGQAGYGAAYGVRGLLVVPGEVEVLVSWGGPQGGADE